MEGRKKKEKLRDRWREASVVEQSYIIVQICIYMYYHMYIYAYIFVRSTYVHEYTQTELYRQTHTAIKVNVCQL